MPILASTNILDSGVGFDRNGSFSFPGIRLGRNVIIVGADLINEN